MNTSNSCKYLLGASFFVCCLLIIPLSLSASPDCESSICANFEFYLPVLLSNDGQSRPNINQFTATVETLADGEDVITFHWNVTNADMISISFARPFGVNTEYDQYLDWSDLEESGSLTVPHEPYPQLTTIEVSLIASNSIDSVSQTNTVGLNCRYQLFFTNEDLDSHCPDAPEEINAVYQPFENGFMIWLDNDDAPRIMVISNDFVGQEVAGFNDYLPYFTVDDIWQDGDIVDDPNISPPIELYQPIRGFGKIWREHPEVRDALGWATEPELGYTATMQDISAYRRSITYLALPIDNILAINTYIIGNWSATWELIEP